jgi:glycerophosphoryl diester phosphodiesterase
LVAASARCPPVSGRGRVSWLGQTVGMAIAAFLGTPPVAIAHQGGGLEHTENSWEAFEFAIEELGYTHLETDVQTTSDGVVICMHDPTFDRTTNGKGPAVNLPWSAVAGLRVNGSDRPPPRLDEVLERWPQVRVNVDPKTNPVVEPLVRVIRDHDAVARIGVGSFSGRRIARVRTALGPQLCTSTGPWNTLRWVVGALLPTPLGKLVAAGSARCYQVPVKMFGIPVTTARSVRLAHAMGRQVHVWTIDDEPEMRRLYALGVDAVMTDRPTVLRAVLAEGGHWPPS